MRCCCNAGRCICRKCFDPCMYFIFWTVIAILTVLSIVTVFHAKAQDAPKSVIEILTMLYVANLVFFLLILFGLDKRNENVEAKGFCFGWLSRSCQNSGRICSNLRTNCQWIIFFSVIMLLIVDFITFYLFLRYYN